MGLFVAASGSLRDAGTLMGEEGVWVVQVGNKDGSAQKTGGNVFFVLKGAFEIYELFLW